MFKLNKFFCASCTYWLLVVIGYIALAFTSLMLLKSKPVQEVQLAPTKCIAFEHPTTMSVDCFFIQNNIKTAYRNEI